MKLLHDPVLLPSDLIVVRQVFMSILEYSGSPYMGVRLRLGTVRHSWILAKDGAEANVM